MPLEPLLQIRPLSAEHLALPLNAQEGVLFAWRMAEDDVGATELAEQLSRERYRSLSERYELQVRSGEQLFALAREQGILPNPQPWTATRVYHRLRRARVELELRARPCARCGGELPRRQALALGRPASYCPGCAGRPEATFPKR